MNNYPFHLKKSNKGLLHRELDIPENEPIPIDRIKSELRTATDPAFRRRLNFALIAKTKFCKGLAMEKSAYTSGNIVDQYLCSKDIVTPLYAHVTNNHKPMHHGKALGIGAGVGAGLGAVTGGTIAGWVKSQELHPSMLKAKSLSLVGKNKSAAKSLVKHFSKPVGKGAVLGALLAAIPGALTGLHYNSKVRTFRAANKANKGK